MSADSAGRDARKWRYEHVTETIRQQTGGDQPALVSESTVRVTAVANGSLSLEGYRSALRAAIQNGDVFRWHGKLAVAEVDPLLEVVIEEASQEHPRQGLIAAANQTIDALREADQEAGEEGSA